MVCECDRLDCMGRVTVAVDVYEHVRSHPDQFLVIRDTWTETVEEVVSVAAGYTIIRKKAGDPRAVAVETDPRVLVTRGARSAAGGGQAARCGASGARGDAA